MPFAPKLQYIRPGTVYTSTRRVMDAAPGRGGARRHHAALAGSAKYAGGQQQRQAAMAGVLGAEATRGRERQEGGGG